MTVTPPEATGKSELIDRSAPPSAGVVAIPASGHVMTAADILDGAKAVLETNGFFQGDIVDYGQWDKGTPPHLCRVDPLGAMNVAVGQYPDAGLEKSGPRADAAKFLVDAIRFEFDGGMVTTVRGWIDYPLRTVADVLTVLDRAIGYAVAVGQVVAS